MDLVLRATFLYLFLLVVLRLAGKRTVAQISTFDLALILIIAESVDNSIIGQDHSITSTALVILTFVVLEIIISFVKQRSKTVSKWVDGTPLVIAENGVLIRDRAEREKVDESDILSAARKYHGISRMEDIRYAVLEKSGGITVIPK